MQSLFFFSLEASDSVTCEKYQMISMRYDHFLNEQSYYKKGPRKPHQLNLGDSAKAVRCLVPNANKVFSTTKTDTVICGKFQVIPIGILQLPNFRHVKDSSKILEPQVNMKNLSPVNQHWPNLYFFIKSQ